MTEVRYGSDHGLKKKTDKNREQETEEDETFKNHKKDE